LGVNIEKYIFSPRGGGKNSANQPMPFGKICEKEKRKEENVKKRRKKTKEKGGVIRVK
jgi:hypothetical protein